MGETVVLHAANVAAAFGVPLTILRVLGLPTALIVLTAIVRLFVPGNGLFSSECRGVPLAWWLLGFSA